MDDRELEGRLRAHLHARLDDVQPSPELMAGVRDGMRPLSRPIESRVFGPRMNLRLGFSLAGAAVVLVVLALGGGLLGPRGGVGGSPAPSGSPAGPAPDAVRWFMVLSPTAALPPKAVSARAESIMEARLRALGIGDFAGAVGDAILFEMPTIGPSDGDVRKVLAAPGIVQFVPIPASDPPVTVGQALPKAYPELFGGDGVARVADSTDQNGNPAVTFDLTPVATQLFGAYTAAHVGDQMAMVVDGLVVSAPIVQSAILDGHVQVTNPTASSGAGLSATIHAILLGGPLPDAWRGAFVPGLIPQSRAVSIALAQGTDATLRTAGLAAQLVSGAWRPLWRVEVEGTFPPMCSAAPASECPSWTGAEIVQVDAVNGGVMGFEQASH